MPSSGIVYHYQKYYVRSDWTKQAETSGLAARGYDTSRKKADLASLVITSSDHGAATVNILACASALTPLTGIDHNSPSPPL